MTQLPIFPLNAVLFPKTPLPLHIFEERYQLLVARCIREQLPFGVVYQRGERMERIGCSARVDRVLKDYGDGRLDIVTIGSRRFSIESLDSSQPYLQALVRFLEDGDTVMTEPAEDLVGAAIDAILRYSYYSEIDVDRDALAGLTAGELSYVIAGIDEIGLETKQILLEIDGPLLRLRRSVDALTQVTDQLVTLAALRKTIGDDVDMGTMKN